MILLFPRNSTSDYPDKWWRDNVGHEITSIEIGDKGEGYLLAPKITLEGGGGSGATAIAFLNGDKISYIEVTNPGKNYKTAPEVVINGSIKDGGKEAKATAVRVEVREEGPVISKFDRDTPNILA